MENTRSIRTADICRLQLAVRRLSCLTYPMSAILTEYALFRTADPIFSGVFKMMNGESAQKYSDGEYIVNEITEAYGVHGIEALCLMDYFNKYGSDFESLKPFAKRIAEEEKVSENEALVLAACANAGFNEVIRAALNMYAAGTPADGILINGSPVAETVSFYRATVFESLGILNIGHDNKEFLRKAIWHGLGHENMGYAAEKIKKVLAERAQKE